MQADRTASSARNLGSSRTEFAELSIQAQRATYSKKESPLFK
jgi:hypothetical protein